MRAILIAAALLGGISLTGAASATAVTPAPTESLSLTQKADWYCGPNCQRHRYWAHRRWERRQWARERWRERHYPYYGYYR